jgi:lipopolysaccharide/colanic/teichoic acid biosynthesis glycosyltransferase
VPVLSTAHDLLLAGKRGSYSILMSQIGSPGLGSIPRLEQASMLFIRKLLDSWRRRSGTGPVLQRSEHDHSNAASPDHGPVPPSVSFAAPRNPLRGAKRAFDIVAAFILIIVFSPIFLLVSVAIKIESSGPIFRRQIRYRYDGAEILALNFRLTETTSRSQPSARKTRIGHYLNSAGIEELPQLVNVLRGEMSVVGPEPFFTAPETLLPDQILLRSRQHQIKPGLTGWAQVNGCWGKFEARKAMQRRIECDFYYFENWSLALDMKIIAKTVFSTKTYAINGGGLSHG